MAGALAVLVRSTLRSDFRRIDPTSARIIPVDLASRVIGTFPENLSTAAKDRLEELGVEVRLGHGVRVRQDLTVPGHPEIFVVGDTASLDQDGHPLPGVAQVAMQQGRYAGTLIHRRIGGNPASPPFRYFDKGNMTVVGKGFAVLQSGKLQISGSLAWLVWAAVHLEFLGNSNLRLSVFVQWVWTYLTGQRGSRIIVHHHAPANDAAPAPLPEEHEPNAPASASESSSPPVTSYVRGERASGAPRVLCSTHKDQINADLLKFLES